MYKYTFQQLPPSFQNTFTFNSSIHSYPTRRSTDYHLVNPKLILALKSIKHHGPDVWNSLPNNLKHNLSLYSFKAHFKKMLLSKYHSNINDR